MNKTEQLKMIADFSNAKGVSGFEDEVAALALGTAQSLGTVSRDSMRNVFVHRAGNTGGRPLVQLDAHTDEVGFMVQHICPNGTLKFVPLGGWVPASVPAHRVWVRTATGQYIPGVVASKPPHFMSEAERKAPPALETMVIDVGATSRADAVDNYHLRIGEPVVPDAAFEYQDAHDIMLGKAFDCRLGCAAMLATLQQLQNEALDVDVVGAFTVQEEVGTRGAIVTSAVVKPDVAIVFEGCPADDTFGDLDAAQAVLKKGPMLRHIDARMITNPRYQRFALDIAKELGIPVQEGIRTGGATNGAPIHLAAAGVPVIVIAMPVRYIHTHYGFAAYADYEASVRLGSAVLQRLNKTVIESF